jgi:flagellar basal-body rod protein FlgC
MIDALKLSSKIAASGLEAQSMRNAPGADPYARKLVTFEGEIDRDTGVNFVKVDSIETDTKPFRIEHDPGHPAADEKGFVKLPNVNMLVEMADMRESSRAYEANLQSIKQAREMINMTIDLLRSNG